MLRYDKITTIPFFLAFILILQVFCDSCFEDNRQTTTLSSNQSVNFFSCLTQDTHNDSTSMQNKIEIIDFHGNKEISQRLFLAAGVQKHQAESSKSTSLRWRCISCLCCLPAIFQLIQSWVALETLSSHCQTIRKISFPVDEVLLLMPCRMYLVLGSQHQGSFDP